MALKISYTTCGTIELPNAFIGGIGFFLLFGAAFFLVVRAFTLACSIARRSTFHSASFIQTKPTPIKMPQTCQDASD